MTTSTPFETCFSYHCSRLSAGTEARRTATRKPACRSTRSRCSGTSCSPVRVAKTWHRLPWRNWKIGGSGDQEWHQTFGLWIEPLSPYLSDTKGMVRIYTSVRFILGSPRLSPLLSAGYSDFRVSTI
jgi:hypothetical protein